MKAKPTIWSGIESGLLSSGKYQYTIFKAFSNHHKIKNRFKIVFEGTKPYNAKVRVVRYYTDRPQDKNICLTVRSI